MTNTLEEMGNPFQEESGDLLSLDTKDIASPSSADRISTHLSIGNASFQERLEALKFEDKLVLCTDQENKNGLL